MSLGTCSKNLFIPAALTLLALLFGSGCGLLGADPDGDWVVNADVWGSAPDNAYIAGYTSGCSCADEGLVKKFDGVRWTTVYSGGPYLYAVWGSSPSEVFAVGSQGAIVRLKDGIWEPSLLGEEARDRGLRDVWGVASDNVFAVGQEGLIAHFDGQGWSIEQSGVSANLKTVWGSGADDIFAAGERGAILHFDGDSWSPMESGTESDLNAIWGSSATDIYAVGGSEVERAHVILHYDGTRWISVKQGGPFHLLGVWGNSASDIYAVGGSREGTDGVRGAIVHFDGKGWAKVETEARQFLWSVWTSAAGDLFAVGPDNTIVHQVTSAVATGGTGGEPNMPPEDGRR